MAIINVNTQQQIKNGTGSTASDPRDEYWFRINELNVNSSNHTGTYSVTYCGTDTSSTGTYQHFVSRIIITVNGITVATLQNTDVMLGNRYTSGSKYIYQSSGEHTTGNCTLGPLQTGDKVSININTWVNSYPVKSYSISHDINVNSNLYNTSSGGGSSSGSGGGSSGGSGGNSGGSGFDFITPPEQTTYYTITYNSNGGYGGPGIDYKIKNQNYYISSTIPSKDITTNTTYTEFTITPNANGGYFPSFSYSLSAAKAVTTTTYYSFKNWSSGSTIYNPGALYNINDNLTLTAQWNSSSISETYYYNNSLESLPIPKRDGYTFKGWSTSSTGSIITTTPTSSITLYAIWEKVNIDYAIDIYVDGKWKKAIPYVYSNGWKKAQAYVYIDKTLSETNYYTDKDGNYYTDKNGNYYIQSISTFSPGWHLCGDPYS